DKRSAEVRKCVDGYRVRKNSPHERVDIAVGIDQEGTLLGATVPHGRKDDEFSTCVMDALRPAVFPRSHSGVISVTKSYEELPQSRRGRRWASRRSSRSGPLAAARARTPPWARTRDGRRTRRTAKGRARSPATSSPRSAIGRSGPSWRGRAAAAGASRPG